MAEFAEIVTGMVNEALEHGLQPPFVVVGTERCKLFDPYRKFYDALPCIDVVSSTGEMRIDLHEDSRLLSESAFDDENAIALLTRTNYLEKISRLPRP